MSNPIRDRAIAQANWYIRHGIQRFDQIACPTEFLSRIVEDTALDIYKHLCPGVAEAFVERVGLVIGLEWPRLVSPDQISFCASIEDAGRNRRTTTKLGSYLARVFPELSGTEIELIVSKARDANRFEIKLLTDKDLVEQMYRNKAHSCMCPCNGEWKSHELHPYNVYSSRLGWAMAVKVNAQGFSLSRSIVRPDDKTFIRIYGSHENGEHSSYGDDPVLRDWLLTQGYKLVGNWENLKLERTLRKDKFHDGTPCFIGPYIDGNVKKCKLPKDDPSALLVHSEGNYCLENTAGYAYRLFEDHEGMVKLHSGVWVQPDEAIAGFQNRLYLKATAVFVERRHNWFDPPDTVIVNGKPEFTGDCTEARTFKGKNITILLADSATVYLLNGSTTTAKAADTLRDYKGIQRFREHCIQMTAGAYTGKFALTRKTCTRNSDGATVLQSGCKAPFTVTQEQWEPGLGDLIRLVPGIYSNKERNPTDCDGTIISVKGLFYTVSWHNGSFNAYSARDPWNLFRLMVLAKDNPQAKERLNDKPPFIVGAGVRVMLSEKAIMLYRKSTSNPVNVPGTIKGKASDGWWCVDWDNGTTNNYQFDDCFVPETEIVPQERELTHA